MAKKIGTPDTKPIVLIHLCRDSGQSSRLWCHLFWSLLLYILGQGATSSFGNGVDDRSHEMRKVFLSGGRTGKISFLDQLSHHFYPTV